MSDAHLSNRTAEEFDAMWNAPNTLRIKRQTMAVQRGPDGGLRIILRHGGDTLAFEFDRADTDKLRGALG